MSYSADHPTRRITRIAWALGLLLILVSAFAAVSWLERPAQDAAAADTRADKVSQSYLEALQSGFTRVAEAIKPSVVFIVVEQKPEQASAEEEGPGALGQPGIERWRRLLPPELRDFFSPPGSGESLPPGVEARPRIRQAPRIPMGEGSGVIIDTSGYILTNNHVVGNAATVTVYLADGKSYPAEVIGADKISDLAVIKIKPDRPLPAAKLGDADQAEVGAWVMAVGYPFGGSRFGGRFDPAQRFEPTVTVGVVSATHRQIESDIPGRPFRDLIQTDAAINLGNSGGPLVNIRAEVIGINQAIFSSGFSPGNIGVGFAIPVNAHTKEIIESLKGGKPVPRGQLGVLVAALTPALRKDYEADHGVFIEEVQPDTPASRAGLKAEDVITKYNGKKVTSVDEFVTWVQNTRPDSTVEVEVLRDGKPKTFQVTLEALSFEVARAKPQEAKADRLGLIVEDLSKEEAQELELPGGVRIVSMDPLGDGARAGLQRGDIIIKIRRQPVADVKAYRQLVADLKKGDPVTMRVWRQDRTFTAQIERLSQ